LALSYDHRVVDGAGAVQFLVAVKEALKDPEARGADPRSLLSPRPGIEPRRLRPQRGGRS
ncbi:MAG: hypothetical protein F6K03_17475, partial [Kamptonema sp. SIO4C4]|nr:hypothetical protein [Kamptonema sp. SIO4C4]